MSSTIALDDPQGNRGKRVMMGIYVLEPFRRKVTLAAKLLGVTNTQFVTEALERSLEAHKAQLRGLDELMGG